MASKRESTPDTEDRPNKKARVTVRKIKRYTPDHDPFPDLGPAPKEVIELYELLISHHITEEDIEFLTRPVIMPPAPLKVATCGRVRKVHDAIPRAIISQNVTFDQADKSLRKLVDEFHVVDEGTEDATVDWNKVRLAPVEQVTKCLYSGGFQKKKAAHIQAVLQVAHQRGLAQQDIKNSTEDTTGSAETSTPDTLSLEYIRDIKDKDDALEELCKLPGVGIKTAACVALFCLGMDVFAIDTHVHRFSKWLRWIAEDCKDEVMTFSHLEPRIPDHLKYGLHQLFILHGKQCYRCRADTSPANEKWDTCHCPLEHLLNRGKLNKPAKRGGKANTIDPKQSAITTHFSQVAKAAPQAAKGEVTDAVETPQLDSPTIS